MCACKMIARLCPSKAAQVWCRNNGIPFSIISNLRCAIVEKRREHETPINAAKCSLMRVGLDLMMLWVVWC